MYDIEDLDGISDMVVNIMFCASSQDPVRFFSKKDKNEYFYSIFCFYIPLTKQYAVFSKFFRILKRKNKDGAYFVPHSTKTELLNSKESVYHYLNDFISKLSDHKRFLNDKAILKENVQAVEAILTITQWEKILLDYFTNYVINELSSDR